MSQDDEVARIDLLALAERVEKASGPDRELDDAIGRAVGRVEHDGIIIASGYVGTPSYTSSMDAAIRLVPTPGKWSITSAQHEGWEAWVWLADGSPPDWHAAATPALALVAAALRARHLMESDDAR